MNYSISEIFLFLLVATECSLALNYRISLTKEFGFEEEPELTLTSTTNTEDTTPTIPTSLETTVTPQPDVFNTTLDTKYEIESDWKLPRTDTIPKWFNYYNSTELFKEHKNDASCASDLSEDNLNIISNVLGLWVACQDPDNPANCDQIPRSPCHPTINYEGNYLKGLKTLKFKIALYHFAVFRLGLPGHSGISKCVDYSIRQDPFSPCEYTKIDANNVKDGWHEILFTFPPDLNISITDFKIELISRFTGDVVLLDKIEGTGYLLCEDEHTICTPPPSTTTTVGTTEEKTETTMDTQTTEIVSTNLWTDLSTDGHIASTEGLSSTDVPGENSSTDANNDPSTTRDSSSGTWHQGSVAALITSAALIILTLSSIVVE